MNEKLKQRACIKFCFNLKKSASETHKMIQEVFKDRALGRTQVFEWYVRFKAGKLDDDERSGRPSTSTTPEKIAQIQKCIREDRRQTIQDIASMFGIYVLRRLRENVRRKRPELWRENTWVLHHDNAPCHTSFITRDFLAKNSMTVVPHPPYSPDLAPCDMGFFPKLKIRLKGRRFETIEEIQTESQAVLDAFTENDFQTIFQKWKKRWDRCIDAEGNYFKGDAHPEAQD